MDDLTDLELCKRIAEIEGVEYYLIRGVPFTIEDDNPAKRYNPMDDALCFQLMVKYECGIICVAKGVFVVQCKMADTEADENTSVNKAILLAIIEAHSD